MSKAIDFNEVFNDSYDFVMANDNEFYKQLYENFISSSPLVEVAFKNTDMEKQKDMLRVAISNMVGFFVSKVATEYIISMAHMHKNLNIKTELFDQFMASLLLTLKQCYPGYNNECAVAWRITMAPGIEFMKHITDIGDES